MTKPVFGELVYRPCGCVWEDTGNGHTLVEECLDHQAYRTRERTAVSTDWRRQLAESNARRTQVHHEPDFDRRPAR